MDRPGGLSYSWQFKCCTQYHVFQMRTLRIALHPTVSSAAPEIKHVFRTLLRVAGYSWEFCWWRRDISAEIYYGPALDGVDALVRIDGCGLPFADAAQREPENFRESQEFVNRVGDLAEEQGHHPDICFGWGNAEISIWTHKIDGLTESDFILAAKIDKL